MIFTIANAKIQAGKRDEFLAAVERFVPVTMTEKGCIAYDVVEVVGTPNHFMTVERWDERASLDAHLGAPHTQDFLGTVAGCVAEAPSVEAMTVTAVDRVM